MKQITLINLLTLMCLWRSLHLFASIYNPRCSIKLLQTLKFSWSFKFSHDFGKEIYLNFLVKKKNMLKLQGWVYVVDSVWLLHIQKFLIFLTTKGRANKSSINQERWKITNRYLRIRHHPSTNVQDKKYGDFKREVYLKKKHLVKTIQGTHVSILWVYKHLLAVVVFTIPWDN